MVCGRFMGSVTETGVARCHVRKPARRCSSKWSFSEGAETGWHRHGHDYVIVPLGDGKLLAEEPGGGTREAPLKDGVPYFREEGVEHNVINASGGPYAFLEIEIKR
jgi:beta-alanine degradation protein BauB